MTQYLEHLPIGQTIDVRGPSGLLVHEGSGTLAIKPEKKLPAAMVPFKKLNMIAGIEAIKKLLILSDMHI